MLALARQRDEDAAAARKRCRLVDEANEQTLTASKLIRQIAVADVALKQRKQQILDAENLLESKHVMKSFSLEELGKDRSRGGGAAGKKRRFEVLDRLARIDQGLSASQKNDFAWFKDAWDAQMLDAPGEQWAEVFAGWVQKVLADSEGCVRHEFSLFVHSESRKCFDGAVALRVP